ncbi:hypothetical protein K1T71_002899 [Dendrolimus kikuchii]|uniref:Uncharacterized protein n=1 Tax=Dendrolimus kikuchii TaxID=765133 RepID=A0ACC1DE54_9NEOP|nr:hypothetical protein K1T71_002899 [Dendrolimus kikuchii]
MSLFRGGVRPDAGGYGAVRLDASTASEAPLGVGSVVGAAGAGAGAICALVAGACAVSVRRRRRPRHAKPPPDPLVPRDAPLKQPEHDDAEPDLIPNHYCDAASAPSLTVASPTRSGAAALTAPACNGPGAGASWTWGARPREPPAPEGAPRTAGAPGALGRSASATLRAPPDLNVDAIKEKLLDHRIPESCV